MAGVRREVAERGARFVLHVGDISYGDGHGDVWHAFMRDIEPVAARVPYMVAVGNHDYDYHGKHKHKRENDPSGADKLPKWARKDASNGECGVALARRFKMPQRGCAFSSSTRRAVGVRGCVPGPAPPVPVRLVVCAVFDAPMVLDAPVSGDADYSIGGDAPQSVWGPCWSTQCGFCFGCAAVPDWCCCRACGGWPALARLPRLQRTACHDD